MLLWVVFGFFSQTVRADCATGYIVASNIWPPYHMQDSNGIHVGLDIEFLEEVLQRVGCRYRLRVVTWKRALNDTKHGDIDIVLAASKTAERESYAWFSIPYRQERMGVITLDGQADLSSITSLLTLAKTGLNVGLASGFWYGADLEDVYKKVPSFKSRTVFKLENENLVDLLVHRRVDVIVGDIMNIQYYVRRKGLENIDIQSTMIHDDNVHIMFSKANISQSEVFALDQAIRSFIASEDYNRLLKRYALEAYFLR